MTTIKFLVSLSLVIALVHSTSQPAIAVAACPTGIIHRGYVQNGVAENTVDAFNAAFTMGFEWVETDMYFTKDGYPVLFHNATVDGATSGSGAIADMTLAQFKALTYRNGQPTSSLQDALPLLTNTNRHILVEIKLALTTAQQQALIAILRGQESQVHLNGFAPTLSTLVAIKKQNPAMSISYLAHDAKDNLVAGMSGKDVDYTKIDYLSVSTLHSKGYLVRAWTPNAAVDWRIMKLSGVDAIITDKAVEYKQWVTDGCR